MRTAGDPMRQEVRWTDLTYEQISTHQAVPVQTVKSRLNRARRALAEQPFHTPIDQGEFRALVHALALAPVQTDFSYERAAPLAARSLPAMSPA